MVLPNCSKLIPVVNIALETRIKTTFLKWIEALMRMAFHLITNAL